MLAAPPGVYHPMSPPRRSNVGRVAGAVIAAIALVGGAAVAGAIVFDSSPIHPDEWDPRVAEIAEFVEDYRGLDFKHPVQVYFLTEERYRAIAGGGENQPAATAEDIEASRNSVAQYRALGLIEGDPDLLAANETLQDSGTLAFYSPDDDVVNVRGTEMTVGLRVTLAHELTHALQDQYFDLSPIGEALTADESGAARSIVEGDATSVETAYVETLTPDEQDEYYAESDRSSTDATDALGDVPDVLQVLFGSYYAVGNAFVTFWQAESGDVEPSNIDEVLERLPTSSGQLFEPSTYLDGGEPEEVTAPEGIDDVFEFSSFGTDFLFLMLAERVDPLAALRATDGWRGDTYVSGWTGSRTGSLCVNATIGLATPQDATEMRSALESWSAAMPPEAEASVVAGESDTSVGFASCDPGTETRVGLTGQSALALNYPVARLQIAALGVQQGRSRESALCYGNAVIGRLTLADIAATERTPAIDAALDAGAAECP